jgi:NADH-quinone oxidoreductase subunit J
MVADVLFYLFAILTVASALLVVICRNPVNGAMFMILAFFGMSALFVLLGAYFLAVLQLLVYAGAVVVLFLFIIMLLDVESADRTPPHGFTLAAAGIGFVILIGGVVTLFVSGQGGQSPDLPDYAAASLAKHFGYELFTKYMLPFQVTGFLLLVAMVGVILLSKRTPVEAEESER